jgi:hypothetical protein
MRRSGNRTVMMIGAAALLVAGAGCGSSGPPGHTLIDGIGESVPAGSCLAVEGPYGIPSGATMSYSISDIDDTDDMDVGVIDDAFGCDFSSGYGVVLDTASVSSGTGSVPAGNYDFVVSCNNLFNTCLFSLTWSASY